jgi:preprotein translocase SecY subunit
MAGRFLNLFKPMARGIPEIKAPERRVRFNEKLLWTGLVVIIYLVMAQIRLYGVPSAVQARFSALNVIFASATGTLMQLGIGPIVTAGLILQLLAGSQMIECDMSNPEDRGLFTTASKVFTVILTGVQAAAYIIGGMFNTTTSAGVTVGLSSTAAIMVLLQLLASGIIVMLLDELVQKGWGFGSGVSLFIMAGVAQQIFWQSFSPPTGLFVGALTLVTTSNSTTYPSNLRLWIIGGGAYPSLVGFIATIGAFLIIIYMEGVRLELPLSYAGYKGFRSRYPIKLLYVSNLPVIFAAALFANVQLFSQLFWNNYNQANSNVWLNLLGQYHWVGSGTSATLQPIGGLAYYVTAPGSLPAVALDPVRALAYLSILIVFCVIFSLTWIEVGGLGPSTVAKQLVDSGMEIPGYRRSGKAIEAVLKRYIPAVTVVGGIIVALIAGISDFFGVFGTGMGILLSVGIIYQYYEILVQERASEMYPAFRRVLGE